MPLKCTDDERTLQMYAAQHFFEKNEVSRRSCREIISDGVAFTCAIYYHFSAKLSKFRLFDRPTEVTKGSL